MVCIIITTYGLLSIGYMEHFLYSRTIENVANWPSMASTPRIDSQSYRHMSVRHSMTLSSPVGRHTANQDCSCHSYQDTHCLLSDGSLPPKTVIDPWFSPKILVGQCSTLLHLLVAIVDGHVWSWGLLSWLVAAKLNQSAVAAAAPTNILPAAHWAPASRANSFSKRSMEPSWPNCPAQLGWHDWGPQIIGRGDSWGPILVQ